MNEDCKFCNIDASRIIREEDAGFIIRDGYPVTLGHTLIIPRMHVSSLFQLDVDEQSKLFILMNKAKNILDNEFSPDGYNIGINDGVAAGQTIQHLHIHLIPRYKGDQGDPRGGVRLIFPHKAKYWLTPTKEDELGD